MTIEVALARALNYGTWVAAALILIGMATKRPHIAVGGIGLLIVLPAFRVLLMLAAFLINQEYRFAVFAAVVLIVIASGFILGARMRPG